MGAAMKRVAITGASGGVGSFAVQIAKAWGAHRTTVTRWLDYACRAARARALACAITSG